MIHAVRRAMNNDSDAFYPYQNILRFGNRSTSLSIETASNMLFETVVRSSWGRLRLWLLIQ